MMRGIPHSLRDPLAFISPKSSFSLHSPKSKMFSINYSNFFCFIKRKNLLRWFFKTSQCGRNHQNNSEIRRNNNKIFHLGKGEKHNYKSIPLLFSLCHPSPICTWQGKIKLFFDLLGRIAKIAKSLQGFFHSSLFLRPQQSSSKTADWFQFFTIIPLDFPPHFL